MNSSKPLSFGFAITRRSFLASSIAATFDARSLTPQQTPHRVLGEEAQAQQTHWSEELDSHWPLEGLAVDVEITDFPAPGRPARGRVLEVLGPPDAFGVDVESRAGSPEKRSAPVHRSPNESSSQ